MSEPIRHRSKRRSTGWWIAAGILAVPALVLNFAGLLQIERLPGVSGAVGPRNALTALTAAAAVLVALIALAVRPSRRILVPFVVALLVVAGCSSAVILNRGVIDQRPATSASNQVRLLSWNINGDLVSPTVVAQLAARMHANVIVLPQIYPKWNGPELVQAFQAAHLQMHAYPALTDHSVETVVFVADSLGSYSADVGHGPEPDKSARLDPVGHTLPTIVALHAAHPTLHSNVTWNADLRWVQSTCAHNDVVAVGDFNGTLDSFGGSSLGRCQDAANLRGDASVGTWPTAAPTLAAMPLDHVLVSPGWTVASFTVLTSEDKSGARHRPIFAVLEHGGATAPRPIVEAAK